MHTRSWVQTKFNKGNSHYTYAVVNEHIKIQIDGQLINYEDNILLRILIVQKKNSFLSQITVIHGKR